MKTYEIRTTYGPLSVKGDSFNRDTDTFTGELRGYEIIRDGAVVAYIDADSFVSFVIEG